MVKFTLTHVCTNACDTRYTGPAAPTAAEWCAALTGSYSDEHTYVRLDEGPPHGHSVMWTDNRGRNIELELTSNPCRLRAKDRVGSGRSYSLSMFIEVRV